MLRIEIMRGARLRPTALPQALAAHTVGFHNFNLRIFNLRVSNPNKLIVDVFLTRCRISMCQGLGPRKHDKISEIDRSPRPAPFSGGSKGGFGNAFRGGGLLLGMFPDGSNLTEPNGFATA